MSNPPIPKAELEAARLRFKRRCAAMLSNILAESNMSVSAVEARIGMKAGYFFEYITGLLVGIEPCGEETVDVAYAMGFEIAPSAAHLPRAIDAQPQDSGETK